MKRNLLTLAAFFLSLNGAFAQAGERYPERPLTLVIPYGPGGDADVFGRNFAAAAPKYLNEFAFDVVNRDGAAGTIASVEVRDAKPDGYTMLFARVATHAIQPALDPRTPYRWTDFTVLSILELDPLICAVKKDSPFHHVRDMLAAIRSHPGSVKYATVDGKTILNMSARYLLTLAGLKADAASGVNFSSGEQAIQGVQDGRAELICTSALALMPALRAGTLRGLFTTATGRLADLPQLQNAREVGLRDMAKLSGWSALLGPRNLPPGVVQRWNEALIKIGRDPEWLAGNARLIGMPTMRSQRESEQFIQSQMLFYERLFATVGTHP